MSFLSSFGQPATTAAITPVDEPADPKADQVPSDTISRRGAAGVARHRSYGASTAGRAGACGHRRGCSRGRHGRRRVVLSSRTQPRLGPKCELPCRDVVGQEHTLLGDRRDGRAAARDEGAAQAAAVQASGPARGCPSAPLPTAPLRTPFYPLFAVHGTLRAPRSSSGAARARRCSGTWRRTK